jgi:hypothetical protein
MGKHLEKMMEKDLTYFDYQKIEMADRQREKEVNNQIPREVG